MITDSVRARRELRPFSPLVTVNKSVIEENIASARSTLNLFFQRHSSLPSQEIIAQANAHLQSLVNNAKVSRYDKQADAEKVIASGRFKTLIEREEERISQRRQAIIGTSYTEGRRNTERRLFGTPDSETVDRPLYAFLSNGQDGVARAYGEVKFVFRDAVRSVGTMTRQDSYNAMTRLPDFDPIIGIFAAVPLERVTIEVLAADFFSIPSPFRIADLLQCQTLDQLRGRLNNDYFEVQLHAPIGVESVERILVKPGIIMSKKAQLWAESQQISIETIR